MVSVCAQVDLAGSERAARTNAQGTTFEEGKLINASLTALGKVVNALATSRSGSGQHVPYRLATWSMPQNRPPGVKPAVKLTLGWAPT